MRSLSKQQADRAREDAQRIWQGEWNRRILLLIVLYATVELVLYAIYDAGTWDTPMLFAFLGAVSVMMVISHRNWFRRLEADLDKGKVEQVEGTLQFPSAIEALLIPAQRYAVFLNGKKLLLFGIAGKDVVSGVEYSAEALPSTRLVVSILRTVQRAAASA